MSDVVIKVENLSKQYRLGEMGTGTLSHDLNRWWHKIRGKEDPYLKIGETNDRSTKGNSDYVWALRDINFEVKQGEVLGIIGKNGAGKSTLLKLLSRVTAPTIGSIKAKGRIASLLEVGTGFHEELTGRENIFLNGAILGMTKAEIRAKFDEIVAFSGTERYIDTPVKRYSSGMRVRLAFAVAAHLYPEILIVDEVLAVGDAEFQKKAIDKIQDVSRRGGKTVLFVSHNMATIQKLCSKGLLLKNGTVAFAGNINESIDKYLKLNNDAVSKKEFDFNHSSKAYIERVIIEDDKGKICSEIPIGRKWSVKVYYVVNKKIPALVAAVGITNQYELSIKTSWQVPFEALPGTYCATFKEEDVIYSSGKYNINLGLSDKNEVIQYIENACSFDIIEIIDKVDSTVKRYNSASGLILNPMYMTTNKLT